ncbi:UNVERIFIED_CONTAM: Quinone-oxidoreductase QR1, chloroplastic [Sesamum angustifolium]|uniref:Quinone-oxidoreductase QR1, chloroplastic n=1 Tax=Sesamum angustifolium TaxID=2727405 RepID=A0AAW2QNP0_9LAMI
MHACAYDGSVSGVVGLKLTSSKPFYVLLASNSPLIPGTDVAGEVVEVGSGVKKFKPGDKVVAILRLIAGGGLSEYGVANEKLTVSRPPEVSAAEGSGLPIAGLTAHMALTQYAATCGARNIDLVKSLGADDVLDYKTPDGAALKSPSGRKYDAVVHCATGVSWSVFEPNLSDKGVVIDLTPGAAAMWTCVVNKVTCSGKRLAPLMLIPKDDRSLLCLVELMKERKLKTIIDSRHRLGRAEEAWSKCIDGHATGKIIVEPLESN